MEIKKHQREGFYMCVVATIFWTVLGILIHWVFGLFCFFLCVSFSSALIDIYCIEDDDRRGRIIVRGTGILSMCCIFFLFLTTN
ncbi:MAG: hypothetical protein LBP72_01425 [Dysgonamonadaceae bacterium]|jgi:hypothetical protein|nr:hypothetical protein [Dysgonamonadaceae bacterium]